MAACCKDAAGRRIGRLHHHRSAGGVSWPLAIRRCVGGISAGMRCCCADVSCGARAGGSPSLITAFSQRNPLQRRATTVRLHVWCAAAAGKTHARRVHALDPLRSQRGLAPCTRPAAFLRRSGIGCDVLVLMCAAGAGASHPLRVHGVPCHLRSRSCRSANRRLPALPAHLRPPVRPGSVALKRRRGWPLARRSRSPPAVALP